MNKSHGWTILFIIGASVTAFLVYFAGMEKGPGITPDSFNYLHAGLSLFNEGELKNITDRPFIEWPPLYPIIISGIYVFTSDLIKGVFWFQVFVAGLTVYLGGLLAQKFIQNLIILIVTFLAIVFSSPIILVNHFIWSESFFSLLFILHLILLSNYIKRNGSRNWYLLVLTGALLCLQRHVGVFMVAGTFVVLLQYPQNKIFQSRLYSSILYGILTIIPLIGWWTRNYFVREQIINDYSASLFSVDIFIHGLNYQNVFTSWFLPDELPVLLRLLGLFLVFIVLVCYYYQNPLRPTYLHQTFIGFVCVLFFYFLGTYVASLVVNEYLDDRILSPVYIIGIILFFKLLDNYYASLNSFIFKSVLLICCVIWSLYPISRSISNVWFWHNSEIKNTRM